MERTLRRLELRIPPVAVWVVFAAAIAALGRLVAAANLPFPGHRLVAVALLAFGVAIGIAGVVAFRRAGTTVDPRAPERARSVVRTGVFRVSRNPMYLGLALGLAGVAAWYATIPGLLLVAPFCLYITQFQIKPEERIMLASFGQEFAAYMAQVRRWL